MKEDQLSRPRYPNAAAARMEDRVLPERVARLDHARVHGQTTIADAAVEHLGTLQGVQSSELRSNTIARPWLL